MRNITRTRIDFLKYRHGMLIASAVVIVAGLVMIFVEGFNYGIDFSGGTMVRVAFRSERTNDEIRAAVEQLNLGKPQIQTMRGEVHEKLIRLESTGEELEAKTLAPGEEDASFAARIVTALATPQDVQARQQGRLDLNSAGRDAIKLALLEWDPDGLAAGLDKGEAAVSSRAEEKYRQVADSIKDLQKQNHGILTEMAQLEGADGMTPAIAKALGEKGFLADYAVLEVGYVGPQVGGDLREKALLAMAFSFLGILAYIWFRFELEFGVAAIAATLHDIMLTLGLIAIFRLSFDLTIVAALLTIVGYSVNDTIVIFDRIRETMRAHRQGDLVDVCNYSLNQTLSRTILTSATTLFVLVSLVIVGGDVTRGFALTLILGIIVGTYSSIYIASPTVILLREYQNRRRAAAGRA